MKIKNCPFCNALSSEDRSKNEIWIESSCGGNYIRCARCGAEGGWAGNVEAAIRKWNRRLGATVINTEWVPES
jgi:hypothetical protein